MTTITNSGIVHSISNDPESILVFQMPVTTGSLTKAKKDAIMSDLLAAYPGKSFAIIGSDINIYEVASDDGVLLKLKGTL